MLDGKEKIMTIDSIKRYTVSGDIAYPIHEDTEGDFVTYADHVAAIEADRKTSEKQLAAYKRLVNSLEARLAHLQAQHDDLKKSANPDLLASERAANAILTEELEADRKSRGKPVAVVRFERNKPGSENEMPRVISCNRLPDGDYQVFLAPQPAEPVTNPETVASDNTEPGKVPSDSAIMFEWSQTPDSGDLHVDLVAFARALLARYGNRQETE